MAARDTVKSLLRRPVRLARRAIFPGYETLRGDIDAAFQSVTAAHKGIADLQAEARALRERLDMTLLLAEANQEEIRSGLLETRRHSLRVAELADVVTEIVLPLHDRDIDPEALERLSADTY